jgi:DNA end-binding protein Ku
LPKRKRSAPAPEPSANAVAPVRPFWSGTITFGLVSIPVDLLSAVRARQTGLKLVDKSGHALGRRYHCSKEGKELDNNELVRGFQTEDGKMIEITDEDLESVAPEMSGDIDLRNFVPLEQIPPMYFQKSYFLAPSGKSAKAYHLLAATMERSGRVGIGSFVMRGHEYLVAIVSDHGVLRADTLRYADEIRTPDTIGLPKQVKAAAKKVDQLVKAIDELKRDKLDMSEFADQEAAALKALVDAKRKIKSNVIQVSGLETDDAEATPGGSAQIIDLMQVLRNSLSKKAVVRNADADAPISLSQRREERASASAAKSKRKAPRKAVRRRSKQA